MVKIRLKTFGSGSWFGSAPKSNGLLLVRHSTTQTSRKSNSVSPVISGQAAVHPQRRRPTRVLSQALRTHHPASLRPSLVAGPGTDSIPSLRSGIPMSQWISAAISRWTADVEGRRHLRSSTTMTLVVPSVQRLTLGDRAFPVAASRA